MHLEYRNVNDAFTSVVELILNESLPTVRTRSRVGDVLQIVEPIVLTYAKPLERVLFNPGRDCNPFFHLYESLWMLAGRRDIAPLAYYSSNYAKQVQDGDDPNANAAYGYRWRRIQGPAIFGVWAEGDDVCPECGMEHDNEIDQIELIIDHLRANPGSRRAVLQIWNVADDLLKIGYRCNCGADRTGPSAEAHNPWCGYLMTSKDVACNTTVYFSVRAVGDALRPDQINVGGDPSWNAPYSYTSYLDMTVCNRSNDIVWGMLGANYVHFSFLQEYMAIALGVSVGKYHQFSNNAHVYVDRFDPSEWLPKFMTMYDPLITDYKDLERWNYVPLVEDKSAFDEEVQRFVEWHSKDAMFTDFAEPFLQYVAQPMSIAFHHHKNRRYPEALSCINEVRADDWREAGTEWLKRRKKKYESKIGKQG